MLAHKAELAQIVVDMGDISAEFGAKFDTALTHLETALLYGAEMSADDTANLVATMRRARDKFSSAITSSLIGDVSNEEIQKMSESAYEEIKAAHAAVMDAIGESPTEKVLRIRQEMTGLVEQLAVVIVRDASAEIEDEEKEDDDDSSLPIGPPIGGSRARSPRRARTPTRAASATEVESLSTTLRAKAYFDESTGNDPYGFLSQLIDAIRRLGAALDPRVLARALARCAGYVLVAGALLGIGLGVYNYTLNMVTPYGGLADTNAVLSSMNLTADKIADLAYDATTYAQYLNNTVTAQMVGVLTQQTLMNAVLTEPGTGAATVTASRNLLESLLLKGLATLATAHERLSPEVLAHFADPAAAVQATSENAVAMLSAWLQTVRNATDMDTLRTVVLQMKSATEATSGIAVDALQTSVELAKGALDPLLADLAAMNKTITEISGYVVNAASNLETARRAVENSMSLCPLTTSFVNLLGWASSTGASGATVFFNAAIVQPIAAVETLVGASNRDIIKILRGPSGDMPRAIAKFLGSFTSAVMAGIASGHLTKVITTAKGLSWVLERNPDVVRYRYTAARDAAADATTWYAYAGNRALEGFWHTVSFIYDSVRSWITGATTAATYLSMSDFITKVSPIQMLTATILFDTVLQYALRSPLQATVIVVAATIIFTLVRQSRSRWIGRAGRFLPTLFLLGQWAIFLFLPVYMLLQMVPLFGLATPPAPEADPFIDLSKHVALTQYEEAKVHVLAAKYAVANVTNEFLHKVGVGNVVLKWFNQSAAANATNSSFV